jgi:hypothetical protein
MLPPDNPVGAGHDSIHPVDQALRRLLPILGPIFDVFEVPLQKRQEVVSQARHELVLKHPGLFHTAEPWLLRRILRICTEDEAEIFWGDGEIPEELLFVKPPFFRKPDDQ